MTPIHQHWFFEDLLDFSVNQIYVGSSCPKATAFFLDFIEFEQAIEHIALIVGGIEQVDVAQASMVKEQKPYQRLTLSDTLSSINDDDFILKGSALDILCQRLGSRSHNLLIEVPESLTDSEKSAVATMLKHILRDAIVPSHLKVPPPGDGEIIDIKPPVAQRLRLWLGLKAMPLVMEHVRGVAVMLAQARSSGIRAVYELGAIPERNNRPLIENLASVFANTNEIAIGNDASLSMIRNMMRQFGWNFTTSLFDTPMFGFDEVGPNDVYLHSIHNGHWNLLSLRERHVLSDGG